MFRIIGYVVLVLVSIGCLWFLSATCFGWHKTPFAEVVEGLYSLPNMTSGKISARATSGWVDSKEDAVSLAQSRAWEEALQMLSEKKSFKGFKIDIKTRITNQENKRFKIRGRRYVTRYKVNALAYVTRSQEEYRLENMPLPDPASEPPLPDEKAGSPGSP